VLVTTRRWVFAMTAGLVLTAGLVMWSATTATAGVCPTPIEGTNDYDYSCMDEDPPQPGTDPRPGDPQEPTCTFTGNYNEFCEGTAACWGNNPAANDAEDVADEIGPKPDDPDAHVAYKSCRRPDGSTYDDWYWATAGGPSLSELAQRAYGALNFPTFTPAFNPPTRTYVNLDTWWWADGATKTELIGSSALGVRALATPDHMEVDPGDGSGAFTCDFVTAKADACAHTYRRASNFGKATARDGSKAYAARMRLVWTVRFERNGAPITVPPGVPTAFSSPWRGAAVPVREIQTVVIPDR
jgi:hypothetical protein